MDYHFDYVVPTDAGSYMVTLSVEPTYEGIELYHIVTESGDSRIDLSAIYLMKKDGMFVTLEDELTKIAINLFYEDGGFNQIQLEPEEV